MIRVYLSTCIFKKKKKKVYVASHRLWLGYMAGEKKQERTDRSRQLIE